MDIQPLVDRIVNSDDYVSEFAKVAADLDDRWKITLAREVNKGIFGRELQRSELNSDIEFEVITTPDINKVASVEEDNYNLEKTAGHHLTKTASEKREKITASMFSFNDYPTFHNNKSDYHSVSLEKTASLKEIKTAELKAMELKEEAERNASFTKYKIEEDKDLILQKVAKELTNPSDLKYFIKEAVKKGLDKEAERVLLYANPDLKYLSKTAAVCSDLETKKYIKTHIDEYIALEKIATSDTSKITKLYKEHKKKLLSKEASAGTFIKQVVNDKTLSLPGRLINLSGRVAVPLAKVPGLAAKTVGKAGKFVYDHPFLSTGVAGGLTAATTLGNASDKVVLGE